MMHNSQYTDSFNPYAPPESTLVRSADGTGLWRKGKYLVMLHEAVLPDRCIKCNHSAEGYRLSRTLYWNNPWTYLLLLFLATPASIFPYLLGAMLTRKRVTIEFGLCQQHREKRIMYLSISCILFLLGMFLLFHIILLGIILLLIAILVASFGNYIPRTKKINKQYVWLFSISPALLKELPDFIGT